jgi:hypothetical protein
MIPKGPSLVVLPISRSLIPVAALALFVLIVFLKASDRGGCRHQWGASFDRHRPSRRHFLSPSVA